MIPARWRKVWHDLWGNKIRTLLVVASITVGVFAVGSVSSSFIILLGDMDADYQSVNPHGAILYCDLFDDELMASIRKVPGVEEVEGRSTVAGRIVRDTGEKIFIEIIAIPPIDEMHIDRIRSDPPGETLPLLKDHEIFLERSAVSELGVEPGDLIEVQLSDERLRTLRVAEIVHDVTGYPLVFSGQATGFVTSETLEWLGGMQDYDQMYITVSEGKTDEAHVKAIAEAVANKVERSGRTVYFTFVYQPGRHFASDITQALGAMMGFLGGLAVFLSAFLVVNTINALLNQHIRQIGIMKSIGARTSQITGMYLGMVLLFGLLALLIGLPLAAVAGYDTAKGISGLLNFNVGPFRIPPITLILTLVIAFIVPVGAALAPVWNGTRVTIREAINDYGIGGKAPAGKFIDQLVEKIQGLPRPLLISLRNTFRRKARLILTLSTLTLAGAIFIAVFNLWGAFRVTIDRTLGYFLSDINVTFNQPQRIQEISSLTMDIPDVVNFEGWGFTTSQLLSDDKTTAVEILIVAPPAGSELVKPVLTSGRWLVPEDEAAIVIGNHLLKERPDLKVGDEVVIEIEKKEYTWRIVGTYQMAGTVIPPIVYANYEPLARILNESDQIYEARVVTTAHDAATQDRVARLMEQQFEASGIQISDITTGAENMAKQTATIDVLVYTLMVMAVLIALVGGLGLMGTMSMNVMERNREIGVMRAIGASDFTVQQMVIVEGMVIGVISWILGALLAFPISLVLDYIVGIAFVTSPLDFIISPYGFMIWLIGILVLSALASYLPARNASRLTVREVLAYE